MIHVYKKTKIPIWKIKIFQMIFQIALNGSAPPPSSRLGSWQGHHRGHAVIRMGPWAAGSKWKTIKQFPSWKEAKDAMKKGTPWRASGNGHPIHLLPLLWKESIL